MNTKGHFKFQSLCALTPLKLEEKMEKIISLIIFVISFFVYGFAVQCRGTTM